MLNQVTVAKEPLICVEYPGVVNNVDKALKTLQGEKGVEAAVSGDRKLELRFRPEDFGCRPSAGEKQRTSGMLLKVKRNENGEIDAKVVGVVNTRFVFTGKSDLQYLPVERQENGEYKSIREEVSLHQLHERPWISQYAPMYMVPPSFVRNDNTNEYHYRDGPQVRPEEQDQKVDPETGRVKRDRHTIFLSYDEKPAPEKPNDEAAAKAETRFKNNPGLLGRLRATFEDRPMWSKRGIIFKFPDISNDELKTALPVVAYYFTSGPWRSLWCRFAYDPRLDKAAKQYQIVDFRIRQRCASERMIVKAKRRTFAERNAELSDSERDVIFRFRPGVLPPYRQMFYQYCDVEEPSVQSLVHENDGCETECTERDGWGTFDLQSRCRDVMLRHVVALQQAQQRNEENQQQQPQQEEEEMDGDEGDDENADVEEMIEQLLEENTL